MALQFPVIAATFITPRPGDTAEKLLYKIAAYLAAGLGLYGAAPVTGTSTGNFWVFHATTTASVTVTYADNTSATLAVPAGDRVYGRFTKIVLNSGTGESYNGGLP